MQEDSREAIGKALKGSDIKYKCMDLHTEYD